MKKDRLPFFNIATGLFLLLFIGLNLNGCSPDKSTEYAGPIESLKIGLVPYIADFYGLPLLAEIEGFFKEQGLDITFVRMSSGADAIKALQDGSVDMGTATEFPFVKAIIQGRNVKVVTTVWHGDVLYLTGRRDRGIRSPSDFRRKKIAVTLDTQLEFFLGRYLLYLRCGLVCVELALLDLDDLLANVVIIELTLELIRTECGDVAHEKSLLEVQEGSFPSHLLPRHQT